MTLKVMSGDVIDIFGKSYYFQNNAGSGPNSKIPVIDILNGLLGGPTGAIASGTHGGVTGSQLSGLSGTTNGINELLNDQTTDNNLNGQVPKAYINYLFFDEQFKCVGKGFSKLGANSVVKDHHNELDNIIAPRNGFVYIYCSNESPVDVFFDNLQVVHTRGPLLEETHYYPFGLTMAGISSKVLMFGKISLIRFNGYEQQVNEFSDGTGLDWYDYKHRFYENQIGRFFNVDELATEFPYYSPYQFAGNEVPNAIDLDGLEPYRPRNGGAMIDAYQFNQSKRSYRQTNSYIPNPRSSRTTGIFIPNQQPASTPANIYEIRESSTDPTITSGNQLGQAVTAGVATIEDIQGQIEKVKVSSDVWQRQDANGSATIETTMPSISIEWKSKEAEASFNALESNYNNKVEKIKSEQKIIPFPGLNASKEEITKYTDAVVDAVKTTKFRIALLGASPRQQLMENVTNSTDFKKIKTEVKILPEFKKGH